MILIYYLSLSLVHYMNPLEIATAVAVMENFGVMMGMAIVVVTRSGFYTGNSIMVEYHHNGKVCVCVHLLGIP